MRFVLLACAVRAGVLAGCATSPRDVTFAANAPGCDSLIARAWTAAAAQPHGDTSRTPPALGYAPMYERPRPREVVVPPLSVPDELRGRTVDATMLVDTVGGVIPGTLRVTGIDSTTAYGREFHARLATASLRFDPARWRGCRVPGRARLTYVL